MVHNKENGKIFTHQTSEKLDLKEMTDLILRDLKQVKYREFKKTLKHRTLDFSKIGQNVEEIRKMNMDHYKEKNLYTLNEGEYISDD